MSKLNSFPVVFLLSFLVSCSGGGGSPAAVDTRRGGGSGSLQLNASLTSLNVDFNALLSDPRMFSQEREYHQTTLLTDGRVLVTGGEGPQDPLATTGIFDPTLNHGVGGWVTAPSLSQPRTQHQAVRLNDGRVLVVGGSNNDGQIDAIEIFDPAANAGAGAWTVGPSIQTPRTRHSVHLLQDGRVLVLGGYNDDDDYLNSVEIFDPTANAGAGAWSSGPAMGTARYFHSSTLLSDGRVLVVGGTQGPTSVEIFSPTANGGNGSWTIGPDVSFNRTRHTATLLADGRVLVVGGNDPEVEIFNPSANGGLGAWTQGPDATLARKWHTASRLPDGRVLVAFGEESGLLNSAEIFNPAANSGAGAWVSTAEAARARRYNAATVLLDGRVLISGGRGASGDILASVEIFDSAQNNGVGDWLSGGLSSEFSPERHTATLLDDGRVLVAGGYNGNALSAVEIYNPCGNGGRGVWSSGPSLGTGRLSHSATKLQDSRVLVAGGESTGPVLSSVEIFDPAANSGAGAWSAGPAMPNARAEHSATLLNDGRVLVVGGRIGGVATAITALFDPAANSGAGGWSVGPPLSVAVDCRATIQLGDGRVLVSGGFSGGYRDQTEIFDPAANSGAGAWSAGGGAYGGGCG